MSAALVSVVIPAKDQENYIYDSLQSLTRQGVPVSELEVIVVDDGSTDNTSQVAQEFSSVFGQFTIIRNETPNGVSAARNQGIEESTGSSLCFLDPDDWYGPNFLRNCVSAMERLDLDFVRTDHTRQTGNKRELWRAPEFRRGRALTPLDSVTEPERSTMLDYPYPCTGLFDSRLVERGILRFDEECATAEDRELMWRVHTTACRYAVISEPGFFYRRGLPGSLTAQFTDRQFGYLTAFAKVFAHVEARSGHLGDSLVGDLQAKAARQFLAITSFHIERIDKAPPTSAPDFAAAGQDGLAQYRSIFASLVAEFLDSHPIVELARSTLGVRRQEKLSQLLSAANFSTVQAEPLLGGLRA